MAIISPLRSRPSAKSPLRPSLSPSIPPIRSILSKTGTTRLENTTRTLPRLRGNEPDTGKEESRAITPEPWERQSRSREKWGETAGVGLGGRPVGRSQEVAPIRERKQPSPKTATLRENALTESFEAMMNLCESYRDSRRSPVLSRISGTEKLIRKYTDVRNYIAYLPHSWGQRVPLAHITQYLDRYKLVRKAEIIDKETASDCASNFFKTSVLISKRFGKPKLWKHSGRIIPHKAETALLGYGTKS